MTRPSRVRVRIDRLVIDGAPEVRADLLAAAITEELTRLAADNAPSADLPRELAIDLLRAPEPAGREIAVALHTTLMAEVAHA